MKLCENIRDIRKTMGMTQEGLAEAMGVSSASVSKWETGQSVPELNMLCALADYFEVSVDALLGHTLRADRKQQMLDTMNTLAEERKFEEAKALGKKLLRNYPNSYEAVDAVASLYYRIFVTLHDETAMETANALVNRLFPLADGGEKARLALLNRLANQYELLEDWEMARKYYEEGNACGVNNRELAYLRAREKGDLDAIGQISDIFIGALFRLCTDALKLKELWKELGEPQRAKAAMEWAVAAMERCGNTLCRKYAPLAVTLQLSMLDLDSDHAQAYIQKAMGLARGEPGLDAVEFLRLDGKTNMIASADFYDENFPMNLVEQLSAACMNTEQREEEP